jgi:hypothetical protein
VGDEDLPNIDKEKSLDWQILFSNWVSKNYIPAPWSGAS